MGELQTAGWTCLSVPGELKPLDPGMEWEKVSLSLSDDDSSDEENNNQDSEDEEYEGMENMQIEDWEVWRTYQLIFIHFLFCLNVPLRRGQ